MFEREHDYFISLYNLLSEPDYEFGKIHAFVDLSVNDWELIIRLLCDIGIKGLYIHPDHLVNILCEILDQLPYENSNFICPNWYEPNELACSICRFKDKCKVDCLSENKS